MACVHSQGGGGRGWLLVVGALGKERPHILPARWEQQVALGNKTLDCDGVGPCLLPRRQGQWLAPGFSNRGSGGPHMLLGRQGQRLLSGPGTLGGEGPDMFPGRQGQPLVPGLRTLQSSSSQCLWLPLESEMTMATHTCNWNSPGQCPAAWEHVPGERSSYGGPSPLLVATPHQKQNKTKHSALPLWWAQASSCTFLVVGFHTLAPLRVSPCDSPPILSLCLTCKSWASTSSTHLPQCRSVTDWGILSNANHLCRSSSVLPL